MSAARAAIRLSPGVCLGVSPFLRRPKCFSMSGKTPRPEGVPNVYRQQKIFTSSSRAISVPGPSIRQIFSAACAPSQSSWTSQRFTTSSGPPTKALRLLFHITTSNTAPHPFLRRSSAHSLFHGAGGCSPADAYQQKNFPLCKSCRFLRAISPIFLLICALGKCCTTSA